MSILQGLDPQTIEEVFGDVPNLPSDFDVEYLPVTRANVNHMAVIIQLMQENVAKMRAELEKIRVALRGYSDSDLVSLAETTQTRLTAAELILATLCDMVLGADADDRSDDALVRAVGEMKRAYDARSVCAQVTTCSCAAIMASSGKYHNL